MARKLSDEDKAWIRGASAGVAMFARREMQPDIALRELGLSRADAVAAGVDDFDLEPLEKHWKKRKGKK